MLICGPRNRDTITQDVDWAKTSSKSEVAGGTTTLPPASKISVEELLKSAGLDKAGKPKNGVRGKLNKLGAAAAGAGAGAEDAEDPDDKSRKSRIYQPQKLVSLPGSN